MPIPTDDFVLDVTSNGLDDPGEDQNELPPAWARLWLEHDQHMDYNQDGISDGYLPAGQWVEGNDNDGNGIPDIIDLFGIPGG